MCSSPVRARFLPQLVLASEVTGRFAWFCACLLGTGSAAEQSADVVLAAKRVVFSVIGTLKAESPSTEAWLPKLQELDRQAAERVARLRELEATGNDVRHTHTPPL